MDDHITLDGIACPCGSRELRVIVPGTDADMHDLIGMMARPVATRGWCGVECATAAGWPWLVSERRAA